MICPFSLQRKEECSENGGRRRRRRRPAAGAQAGRRAGRGEAGAGDVGQAAGGAAGSQPGQSAAGAAGGAPPSSRGRQMQQHGIGIAGEGGEAGGHQRVMPGDDVVRSVGQLLAGHPALDHAFEIMQQGEGVAGADILPEMRGITRQHHPSPKPQNPMELKIVSFVNKIYIIKINMKFILVAIAAAFAT